MQSLESDSDISMDISSKVSAISRYLQDLRDLQDQRARDDGIAQHLTDQRTDIHLDLVAEMCHKDDDYYSEREGEVHEQASQTTNEEV
mgnify:FL=1